MSGINVNRWLAGGVAAGILIWILEGIGSVLYMGQMETALEAHNLSMEMSTAVVFISIVVSLVAGLTLVFFYAAARPRFGPGPKTAVIVAVALWFGSMFLSLMGYHMMNLFPPGLLVMWGVMGLVEWILAALLGGVIYKEA
ncbi:MAG: hypothetical protein JSW43_00935 [Gemmatimonadota bacterium]|nr:MAG: hypothetical protein JSW43_00935 [Gemmatimonadota bacterium]